MTIRKLCSSIAIAAFVAIAFSVGARAQDAGWAAEACNSAGACAPMDPQTAIIIVALAQIAQELSKDEPFGKNNELTRAVRTMINDIKSGAGPNNDFVKLLSNSGKDLTCGPGPNNDVVKFLGELGVKVSTRKSC